ncbi:hypothetical protein CRG98_032052 [Punica granatum]|uniref:Uncharacterized protein n=1 Tax=Punica granatum TaxID=22663 RepID=A0A2I0IU76_PUNGR|nr:hypothetical protein CRG98_032052 [Punica granatum]
MSQILVGEVLKVNMNRPMKPYEAGGSSSDDDDDDSTRLDDMCFRVYSKGLVSEEWVKERKVAVAGIG